MNKIFKVIWSKSKQCYIVVSEIAKNKTGKKKIVVASILAALAMQSGLITEVMAADPPSARLADASQATGTNGLAIGSAAKSMSNQSVAIGYFSVASAPASSPENPATAVGAGANAIGAGTSAYGLSAYATADYATAIGRSAKAAAINSIAIGKEANVTAPTTGTTVGGQDSIAMGTGASANQHSSVSVGLGASSDGVRSVAIGPKASATDEDTIAIGTGGVGADKNNQAVGANGGGVGSTLVNGVSGVSLYYGAKSSGKQSIAIGYIANAKESGIAFGNYAVSDGGGGTAMGKSVLSRNGGVVVGQSSNAIGKNSVAYGNTVKANGETSTAMGYSATADGQNAVAVGYSNTASNKDSVAIGNTNQSTNQGSVTVGYGNNATNDNAVAIGRSTNASGLLSTAIGNGATSQGTYDVAIGSDVTANGNNSVAIGRNAKTSNTSSLAIGVYGTKGTSATGAYSIAMGRDVTASAESAIAIGKDAVSDKKNAVAIGSGTDTSSAATAQSSATIAGKSYSWSKGVLSGADLAGMQVSVGKSGAERQIKNVAAGEVSANSTDAINGSQLYAVASGLAKDLKFPYVSINSSATGANSNFDNDGAKGANSIAIGPSSTVTRQNSIAIGSGAQSLSEDSVVIGRDAKAETKTGAGLTTTSRAIVIGSNSRVAADVTQGVAIGSGLSPDEGAVVTGDQSIAIGGNVKVDGHSAIAIGGDDARKAANQLVSYTNKNDAEVTGTLQTAVFNLTGYNLNDYKGTTASHAGVAYGASALAGNAGVAIGTAADSMTRKNDKGQVVNNNPVTNAVAIGTAARANFDNSVAIGGGSNTDRYATKQVNAIIDGVEVKWSGGENISPGDVVSFGAKGFERQLKNVAPGEVSQTSTDAVNGSQIYSLARKVTNIMNGGSGSVVNVNATGEPLSKVSTIENGTKVEKYYRTADVKDDGTLVTGAVAQTPASLALVNVAQTDTNKQTQTPRILGNVANGVKDNDAVNVSQLNAAKVKYFSVNSSDAGNINNDGATGTDAIAIGPSATSNDVGSVALGKDAKANGAFTVALGGGNWQFKGAQANGVGTTALGSNTKTQENINYQTAIGFGATTSAESALALGYNAAASAQNAIALGREASTAGQGSLALGVNSQANGGSALAMGPSAQANSNYVVSLGYQANNGATNNANGVSIGWAAGMQSNGSSNVGIGSGAGRQISGNNNVSIGNGAGNIASANLYTSDSIMLGSEARAINGTASKAVSSVIAIGKKASGGADSAIALGQGASSTNQNSIAIGTNSQATAYNGVAIGAYSVANTAGGVAGFNPNTSRTDTYSGLTGRALTSTTGAVAIGSDSQSRQLTGLAAGTQDTDAVNVAQLKSVNLAFKGNAGTGDVNLAAHPLTIQGNDNYITTSANGNTINISGKVQNITVTNGTATAANKGMADAQNVADAINNAVQSNAYKWKLTANGEATPETIAKDDTVDFSGDTNISVARNGKKITTSLKKDITVDSVKANKSITTGSGSNQITLDGTSGAVIGRTFSGQSFAAGDNVLSNTTLQIGSTTNGNNVTITKDGITSKAGSTIAKFGATGIDAGGQRITNVSSGGNVGTNAANITDVKNAVSDVTLKLDTNSKTGTVKLSDGSLKIVGANGIRTDLTGTNKDNLVIGLDSNTVNATTKGIGLSGDSGTMLRKFLKDGDADFKISGDGGLVTTSGTTTGVQVSVDKSKVKDLAVEAVTVSKANTVDNPITVTPTTSTNSKDYAIGIDTTKLAAKTNLAYTANGGTAKTVSLAKGLNFVNGTNTVSSVDSDGKVSFDLNQATKDSINKSATAVGRTITLNADSGTGSSQSLSNGNVSFAVSGATGDYISTTMDGSAVKVSTKRATINSDANTGAASVTGADGLATAKNVASAINNTNTVLGNKITKNTQDIATNTSNITANKNQITTNTTNIATNTTNIAHTIALADDKGTSTTAKSLKDGNVSFNIKGDNKYISTAASGNDVTLTVNEQAIKDAAKSVSSFKVKANTHAEEEVKGGDTIAFNNGDNIEISQNGKTFTIGTAKNITVDSVTAGNTVINTSGLTNGTTAITGTGITTDKVTVGGLSIDKTAGINAGGKVISNVASGGTTDSNAANIGDVKQAVANLSQNLNITDGTNNGTVDLKNQKLNVAGANGVTATVNNQTITVGLDANTVNATTKGIGLTADTGSTGNKYLKDGDVSFAVTGDGNLVSTSATTAGVKVAVDTAKVKDLAVAAVTVSKDTQADNPITVTPTAGTNSKDYAIGIDTTKLAAKTDLTYRANTATDANAKKVSLSKGLNFVDGGSTVATVDNDGKVSFDLNTATKNQINTNTTDIAANKGKIATNTTNIAANTTALARNISLGADTGTAFSQSLSTADVAFNVKGATGDFVSTNMNGNTVEISTKRATINSNATTGEASVTGNDGLATAQNVADAINKAADAAKAGAAWNITTNSSTTDKTAVKGGDTVDLVNGDNIEIIQDGTDKKKITVATKKDITVDSVTANNKVTVGAGANKITLDGTDGSITGKAFTGTTFTGTSFTGTSFTAGNTVINTNGLTNGTTAITGTGVTTDNVTVGGISIDKTTGINAGNKVISNVASGGTTLTNAANIGDVQNAVANLSQNLNITDGTNNGTVDLKHQKLNVAGANGVTATINNQTITVGLDADTVNATTKGIGLTADTGSTGNKYLKDGDVSFAVTGDGSLVSTSATAAGVKVAVNSASITAGTDGTITAPTTDGVATAKNVADAINAAKKASKTEITANTGEAANATTGNVTLTSTTAADGHTIYDVKLNDKVTLGTGANAVTVDGTTGAITGKTANIGGVTVNGTANTIGGLSNTTWNGTATTGRAATEDQLKAVADAAGSQTWEITADKDAATSGAQTGTKKNAKVGKDDKVQLIAGENLTVNQNERDFTYSLNKDLVKMNSATFEATGGKTTVIKGDSIVQTDGTNVNTSNATSNTITDGTNTSTITAGKAQIGTVGIDGVASKISTGGTNAVVVNGADGTIKTGNVTVTGGTTNDITGLSNTTLTATDFATKGRAATEEQLKAATGATTLKFTGDIATNTGSVNLKDDTFGIKGDGKYISTDVNGKNVNLTVSEAEVKKSAVAAVTVSTDTTDANNPLTVTPTTSADGTTKDYKVTIDGTKIANKTNLSYKANDGTAKQVSLADGLNFKNGTLTTASIDDAGVVKYDVNTASITAGTDGTITGPTTDGVATAQNVADAINAAKKASKTEITANTGEAANATKGNVTLTSTTAVDGHTIYDVKLNDKVTLGTGANAVTIDGTTGAITGKTATIGGVTVNGTANTIGGLSNTTWNGTATTGRAATEDQLKAVADAASSQTWNITADKAGTTGNQTGTKKNATVGKDETVELVAGDNLTINQNERKFTYSLNKDLAGLTSVSIGTGTTETIKLDGATGKITAKNAVIGGVTVDGDNNHVTGLANTTWNGTATTGRAATEDQLKAVAETAKTTTDAVNLKFSGNTNTSPGVVNLKDDTLGIVGDGKYVSTDANGKNLTVKVSEAEVKKSAVAAVTVSTDTTDANNPISVTPTTSADGTTKDYKVTIDGTKIANKTNLSYKANGGTVKQVSLADGLNFKNGILTTASIDDAGVVKYDVNTASITAGADGTITGPTTDGVATAQNVADAINAAKKASKTEITANTGEAANATTGNVTLTSTTAADGHTIYDVKLNDKVTLGSGANAVTIDGTAGKATIGSSVINGVNNTFTTGGAKAVTLDGATGTITGTTANIGGVTVNGTANTIGGLSNTTWNGTATTGRAATEDQLKAVADAAGSQTWEITADKKAGTSGAQTGTKENAKVGKDDKVSLIAGENLTVDQAGKNFTYSLNTDLVKMNSATFLGTGTNTTVITGDSITQTAGTQTNTSTAAGNTVANGTKSTETTADGQVIKDGTKINTSTVDENTIVDGARSNKTTVDSNVIDDGNGNVNISNATSNTITDGTNTSTITAGKATIGSSVIDGVNNTFTTGGANAVKLDGAAGTIKTGTVTVTGGTTNDITGLSNTTLSATDFATKGRAATEEQLKAATGATTLKFTGDIATNTGSVNLKDDTFGIKGDGKYISTDVNGKNVNLTVSEAEVKKSAVAAVTVSTDTTDANNPISVTPTTSADGTTKDYKVTIDGTKIANKTNLSYKANDGTAKQVSLADGLNFKNGTLTTASIDDAGVVKYDVNTAAITAGTDGTITGPTKDGVATAQNVADAINAAKKASKTEITANTGEAANATIGNVTLTSTTAADGHTIYDVKLNDKVTLGTGANVVTIDGTAGKATIGSSIVDGVNNTFTTGGASPVTLNGATGTITGKTANIGGVTVDGTNNHVMGLANKDWTPGVTQAVSGRAATEDQLQKVSDAVGAGWKVNTGKVTGSTGESNGAASTKVASGEEVQFQAGNNLIVDQNGKTVAYSLNKALKDLESATFNGTGTNKTVITGDSITQTAGTQTNTSTAGGNIVADGANSTAITAAGTTVTTANGNTNYAADGVRINTTGKTPVSLTDAGLDNGNNVIKNVASGHVNNDATDNTNAANIADVKKATTTVTANAGEAANATTGNVTLTSTTAVDGHTIYDVKLNDKVTLGTGANAVTIDGTAGKATVGSSVIDGVNNTFTTGGANAVKLDGAAGTIKTGTVTVTGGTTNDITGLSNTTVTAADFATKGRAATEEQLKAVGEQTWQITADKDAATSGAQTGTKKDAKVGKDDKVQLIAGENMTVNQNERDFTFTLNKDLVKMNSATFEATGGKTTVIKGDSIVQTDGTKVNTSTAGGNTVVDGTKSTATTADGTTVTSANGNTKYAADGVRINTTGKNPVSLTDVGLDNGNNVIKNVASGHVNNDATDNTNAANIADVKKATTTVTANAGEAANATKGNVTLTSTTAADGHTIYDVKLNDKVTLGTGANAVTIDGTAGKATVGSSVIDGVNNTFTTGGASPVTLNGATGTITGKTANIGGVTVDGTNNHVMGLANKDWTPGVTQAVSGRAATEDQLQKVSDAVGAGWKINTGKVTGSTGESNGAASTKVASGEEVQFQAGNNLIVDQNGKTVAYSLNKALKDLESATFNGTGTNKTVITGDSITQTAGTQTNTSTAGGNTVADGTKSTETTAAGQVIKDGTKTNTSTVDENTIVDGAKSNKTTVDSNAIDDGTGNVNTSNATSNTITDGTNTTATTSSSVTIKDNAGNSTVITKDNVTTGVGGNKITLDGTAGKATVGSSVVDGVNNTFTTGGTNAVKLDGAAGTVKTGTVTVTGGTTNDITGLSNTTVTSADFATKGRAATEEQLKAVGEQTWQITADKDATTSGAQTGTKKDAKVGKDDKVQLIAGENLTVNQNERDFTYSLNKDLVKMNSATFEATGGKTTVIKGDSIVQTDGTKVNTSTAGGNTVADGTKSTETTAAGQVIKDGAKSNKSTVDNNVIDDGNGNVNTSNVTSNTITDGTNTTATTSSSVTVKDNTGNNTVITKDNITTGVGANKITLDGTAGKATIGSSVIDGVNNTFTTGGANAVKLDGAAGTIKTGTVTVTGGTTNDITGLSNTTVNSADFATKGRAATEEQLKAVGEQTWQITADKDTATSGAQTGTKKDAKVGKDDKVSLIAGENMTINQNERDFTFTLNKDLVKMNSATFLGTGTNTTVITGDSITQTAGTQTNTSTAGGNTVADGTKSTETTATGQVIKDGAKSNKSTVDNNVIDDGNGNVNTSNATSNTITDGTNTSTITAGKATIGTSIVDGVNNTFTTGGTNAVKLDGAAGTIKTGTVTVTGGTTNDITGLSNTTVNSADFATKGRAATEEQLKAVGEQTWQITADKDTATSGAQTGTKKDAKVGKDDKVSLIAGENMTINQNERDFTFTLNKDLVKMNSATFLGTGSNTTVITGNSITQTAGTQTNTSTAGGNTVADGTKSTKTTADGQVIKDGTKSNKSTVDNNVIDDGNGNVNTSNATSNTITDGTNTTATTSSSVTVKDNAGNSTVITKDNVTTGVGANKIILDGTAGKATIGSSVVDGVNNTFTTGGTNAVTLDGGAGTIKTGTVTVTGGTTNDITGLSNTTVNSADFATKGRAATEEQLKAVGEQTWQITADKDTATSGAQTGTKKDAKVGKDNKVQLIAGENMTINQNERDFTFTLNKDLVKMNSATFLGTGSNTTVITGNSITQTAGTQTNTSTAGGNTVADGTKSTETTAAGQVIKDGAKTNKSTVDTNVIDDGNGNKNISNATSNTITDGTNTSTITAGKANIGNIAVDGVNNKITMGNGANPVTLDGANGHLDGLTNTTWVPGVTKATTGRAATEDQLQQVSDAVGAGWKVNTGTVAGSSGVSNGAASTKVSSGEEVKLQAGDNLVIDQNGKTVSYSLNKDLTKMNSATFEATGGKTTVIKGDSIIQTDGGKTNTSTAAGNTVVDGNKSTATTAAGTTITDGAKTNTSTADKNVINDGVGNTNTSTATSNTLKNAAGDETKADAKGVTVKDAAGNNATFNRDGITITKTGKDTVSLTSNGLDNGNNKIVNVAAGVANTDAVNVGQLKEYAAKSTTELTANGGQPAGSTKGNIVLTKTTAADGHTIYDNKLNDKITLGTDPTKAVTVDGTTGTVTGLTNKTWTPGSIVSGRAATEDQLKEAVADSGWKAAVDKEGSGQSTVVGTSPEKIKAEETVTFKAGNNMMVTQTGKSISYAVNPELTNMTSATFKDAAGNTTVTNGNGITITPGSANPTNPHAGPVSLTKDGLNNGNNQIKGVAPGTDPTDAVNVSQLNASNANTSQAINQIAGEVQHVGAHAAAMAALKPIQYDPLEPTQVMAGVGNYRGETAAALGLAHYTNENTMFNVGVSVGGNHNMVNAGVTHKFGYSPEKKNIPDRYKAGPISSVYVMQDEVSSLKKENAEQKYVIADQAARLTTLEAENEQQRRELAETKKGLDDLKAAVDKLLASKG